DKIIRALGAIEDALGAKREAFGAENETRGAHGARRAGRQAVCSPKGLLKAAGHLISFAVVLGSSVLIKTKPLYEEVVNHVQTRGDWNKRFVLSEEAIKCLEFWRVNLPDMSLKRHLASKPTSCVIFSDASATGGSAFISKIGPGRQPAVGEKQVSLTKTEISGNFDLSLSNPRQSSEFIAMTQWDKCQQKASSTWRELKTIERSLESFGQVLQGRKVSGTQTI
ncbi:MAG: hypothetical protein GY696_14540, partial [Gammaproteobacteria bacterium]|nr:hypothetical protein [Gammaproteobacteria bacterium]